MGIRHRLRRPALERLRGRRRSTVRAYPPGYPGTRARRVPQLLAALAIALAVAYVPLQWLQQARSSPPIHDVTTDTQNPPLFSAVIPLRAQARNPVEYGGPRIAELQQKGYPDIVPLMISASPDAAFKRALDAASEMGWAIVAADASSGRIEATATTPLVRLQG